jgi:putative FmdB family regulatory protein
MPIYEYQCPECGGIQETLILPGGQEETVQCRHCGASGMQRVLSAHAAPPTFRRPHGQTCCGREERCSTPPCSSGGTCSRG